MRDGLFMTTILDVYNFSRSVVVVGEHLQERDHE